MISLIVSSYQKHYFEAFSKNVEETIGVPYEIIDIWNPGKMGICEAYNLGASKAQYPYLVFCHEDILFHTENWGKILIDQLSDDKTGVVGVAGSNYVPKAPSGWFIHDSNYNKINIIQHNKKGEVTRTDNLNAPLEDVFAVDGVFMAVTAKHFAPVKFNKEVKGFHSYDLDFSLRMAQHHQNKVTKAIILEHFSFGSPDKTWFYNTCQVRAAIPHSFNSTTDARVETEVYNRYMHLLFRYEKMNAATLLKALKQIPAFNLVNIKEWLHFAKHKNYYNKRNGHA